MSGDELRDFRRRLWGLVAHVEAAVSRLEAELRLRSAGPDLRVSEWARAILGTEGRVLGEANDALARIDLGTFGRCEGCERPIPRARLGAMPYARHCGGCARTRGADSRECAAASYTCSG